MFLGEQPAEQSLDRVRAPVALGGHALDDFLRGERRLFPEHLHHRMFGVADSFAHRVPLVTTCVIDDYVCSQWAERALNDSAAPQRRAARCDAETVGMAYNREGGLRSANHRSGGNPRIGPVGTPAALFRAPERSTLQRAGRPASVSRRPARPGVLQPPSRPRMGQTRILLRHPGLVPGPTRRLGEFLEPPALPRRHGGPRHEAGVTAGPSAPRPRPCPPASAPARRFRTSPS